MVKKILTKKSILEKIKENKEKIKSFELKHYGFLEVMQKTSKLKKVI